jgi:oxysterol-binding protein-related protein 9/10/11
VVYLTEQVSHHPPVSAYYAACPARSLELYGIDQISAKVSGTTLRVLPGQFNQGLYVNITDGHGKGEKYHITHPTASVNGILRGSFYVTVGDTTIITCTGGKGGQKFRTIIEYKEEVRFSLSN